MSPQTALIELRLRLNKLHSSDYDNIPDYAAVKAINKEALEWFRRQVIGLNLAKAGDEETTVKVDDLQQFLVPPKKLKCRVKGIYCESELLPADYLFYKRLVPIATKGECKGTRLYSSFVEEANVSKYLADWSTKPSFEWQETFHTLAGNRVLVYTDADFKVDEVELSYYRKPKQMDVAGYTKEDGTSSANVDLEFKDDIAQIILDGAAAIIAGGIESINQFEINRSRAESNS